MNFGIVGCGMIAGVHARAIREIPGCRVAAVFSRTPENARRLAAENGADAEGDLRRLLDRRDVQAVCICTPSGAHHESVLAAAAAGKHVLVEKPIEVRMDRAREMVGACRAAGVRLAVAFPSRFFPASRRLRTLLGEGGLGRLVLGSAYVKWWRPQRYYDEGGWKGTIALDGGGALMNQSIHAVDLLLWLLGPAAETAAFTGALAHERIEVEDTAVAAVRFESGALGVIEGTTGAYPGFLKRVEIHGDRGSAVLEEEKLRVFRAAPDGGPAPIEEFGEPSAGGGAAAAAAIKHENHRRQIEDFVRSVREGRDPEVTGEEGLRSLALVLAIYRSAGERRFVPVEQTPADAK